MREKAVVLGNSVSPISQSDLGNAPLIVGLGGGVNSWAAIAGLFKRNIVPDLISFADTLGEKPETYEFLSLANDTLVSIGFPRITTVVRVATRTGDKSLEDECIRNKTLPSRAFGGSSCAQKWKILPQDNFLRSWKPAIESWEAGIKPIKIIGYDGGELRRASIREDGILRYWYPLIEWDWDRERCVDEIRSLGWPIPPKSACFFCPSSKKHEVLSLIKTHPDLYKRAVNMEQVARDAGSLTSCKGLGRSYAWEDLPSLTPKELGYIPDQTVEGCIVCDDDGCEID